MIYILYVYGDVDGEFPDGREVEIHRSEDRSDLTEIVDHLVHVHWEIKEFQPWEVPDDE